MHRDRNSLLLVSLAIALGAVVSCTTSEPVNTGGTAGSTGGGTAGSTGTGNTTGTGGTTAGTAGSTGTAGSAAGTAGSTGTGGSVTAGTAGSTGAGGSTNAGTAGSTGAGGSTGGTAGSGADAGVDAGGATLSFAKDIFPIITANCHQCHQTGTDGNLNLKADANNGTTTAYTSLVGTGTGGAIKMNTNCKLPAGNAITLRVKPNDPANSLMYLKITTTDAMLKAANCGDSMPKNAAGMMPLGTTDATDTQKIHDWIMQGALP